MHTRVESSPQVSGVGYAARRVTKAPDWHALVALDMLFNNLTTGLFLVAASGDLAAPGTFGTASRLAYPIALAFLLADLLCLVLDLGHRLRFHHMLRVFRPSSPMSLGTWCLTAYSLPLTVIAAIEALRVLGVEAAASWIRAVAVVVGLPFAFGAAVYKGVLFSTTSQPGWKDARMMGGYLTHSAITIGCAEMLAIATVLGQGAAVEVLRESLFALLGLNLVLLAILHDELRRAIRTVADGGRLAMTIGLGAIVGGVLPAGLVLAGGRPVPVLAALAGIIVGNFLVRWAIVMLPHEPLKVPIARRA